MPKLIILFDGLCPLCHKIVRLILRFDTKKQFYFVSQQSQKGLEIIDKAGLPENSGTIILWVNNLAYEKSGAVFEIIKLLGLPFTLFYPAKFLPIRFTDACYDFIAGNRNKWFGKYDSCPIPPEKWQNRFIGTM